MYKTRLQIRSKFSKRRLDKRVEDVNRMEKDTSIAWTITAFITKMSILLFFGAIILFPFFYMISTALMGDAQVDPSNANTSLVSNSGLHWENFTRAFQDGYLSALLVTVCITIASIILKVLFTMTMGYAFSYKKWWGKKAVWYFLLALMMVPEIALMVGQYKLVVSLHLQVGTASTIAMVLPFIASIFSAFMFRNAFEAIPTRTKEAALIDGATEFKYFVKVAVPMVTPTIWTVVILTAFASWNSYIWPQLLAFGDPEAKHVLGTWLFTTAKKVGDQGQSLGILVNVRLAASILIMLPMLITYFLFRTRIMRAISRQGSAIKG